MPDKIDISKIKIDVPQSAAQLKALIERQIEEGWAVGKREIDVVIGANQWRWNCALIRTPMFYQADGHNDAGTWDYAKDPIVEPQETRVDRIRAERHQLAGVS